MLNRRMKCNSFEDDITEASFRNAVCVEADGRCFFSWGMQGRRKKKKKNVRPHKKSISLTFYVIYFEPRANRPRDSHSPFIFRRPRLRAFFIA